MDDRPLIDSVTLGGRVQAVFTSTVWQSPKRYNGFTWSMVQWFSIFNYFLFFWICCNFEVNTAIIETNKRISVNTRIRLNARCQIRFAPKPRIIGIQTQRTGIRDRATMYNEVVHLERRRGPEWNRFDNRMNRARRRR